MNNHSLSTSSFKKIWKFLFKILAVPVLLFSYLNWIVFPEYEGECTASLIDKVERLESIDEPKLVLIGNSNLTFGINSELLEEAFGMPVVNMGLHGGLGNAFHEEMAKYNVTEGDIYVLCHNEYNDDNTIPEPTLAWITVENHYKLWQILRPDDFRIMLEEFPVYLKKSLLLYAAGSGNEDPGGVYARSSYNEYGDVYIRRTGSEYIFESNVIAPQVNSVTADRINNLNKYLTERGATLVVAGYPIGNGYRTVEAENFISFQDSLEKALDCPVISNYVDYLFDYKYFYNTELHLNTEGMKLRTEQLIADLKRWQANGDDAGMEVDRYEDIISDVKLSHITDLSEYLSVLNAGKDRYTILLSVKKDASNMDEKVSVMLQELGFTENISGKCGASYAAVVEKGEVLFESCGYEKIKSSGLFDERRIKWTVVSGGVNRGNCSSILLNGQEYSRKDDGLNIVVYSNETHRILDEVCFNVGTDKVIARREDPEGLKEKGE